MRAEYLLDSKGNLRCVGLVVGVAGAVRSSVWKEAALAEKSSAAVEVALLPARLFGSEVGWELFADPTDLMLSVSLRNERRLGRKRVL